MVDHLLVEGRRSHQGLQSISLHHASDAGASGELSTFRQQFYACLTRRADALFELCDAMLCGDGPVRSIAELSLVGEHRRGHGSGYASLAQGQMDIQRLRTALTTVPIPKTADGRLVLAVDITSWLRPEAHTCPQRILCHTYGRGKDQHTMVPGWPYSVIVAFEVPPVATLLAYSGCCWDWGEPGQPAGPASGGGDPCEPGVEPD